MHPDAGNLIWADFDPTRGREQSGRRPALVLSAKDFTAGTELVVVCPITSCVQPFPFSVILPTGMPVGGEVLTSHIRSLDTLARPVEYSGASISLELADEVQAKLAAFITI